MKNIKTGTLPWSKMTNNPVVNQHGAEMPEDSYDVMKATETKVQKTKPRTVAFTNFNKQQSRDEARMNTTDRMANVKMENTKDERELEI